MRESLIPNPELRSNGTEHIFRNFLFRLFAVDANPIGLLRLPMVAVVDAVLLVTFALTLFSDRCAIFGKRHQPHLASPFTQPLAQLLRLRFLAALIEALEGDKHRDRDSDE